MSWPLAAAIGIPLLSRFLGGGDQARDVTQRQEIPEWLKQLYLEQIQRAKNLSNMGGNASFNNLFGGTGVNASKINMGNFLPQSRIALANPLQQALAGG